ncbi:unnamed protein product [Calypogeia fissa]
MAAASIGSPGLLFTDVKLSIIQPLHKTEHVEVIDPTFLDSKRQDGYFPIMVAFRLGDKADAVYPQHVKKVKDSLQEVLISFFSYAGRWIADPKDSSKRKLLCNDKGVPIIEAYVDDDLDSVMEVFAGFQPVPELQGYQFLGLDVTQFQQQMLPDGLPCIFLQITRFKCGGLVLALTFNHQLTDGLGFVKFLTAWFDIAQTNETTIEVDHNRAQIDKVLATPPPISDAASTNGVRSPKMRTWAMKAFEVSASTINSIKLEVPDIKEHGGGYVSTVDCIAAHMWRSLVGLPSSILGGKEVAVVNTVEGRARFYDTPLSSVCANVLSYMVPPKIPSNELRKMPLASIASKLRETFQTTRREEWLGLERLETFANNEFAAIQITSWLKFPLYEFDFGWGKPVLCSLNTFMSSSGRLGKVYVLPPYPNSSSSAATVQIWSTPEVLNAMEGNPLFLELFLGQHKRKQGISSKL